MYYTQYLLPTGQKIIQKEEVVEERQKNFELEKYNENLTNKIVIKDITITNGTLKYKEEMGGSWQLITNYTINGKNEEITVSKTGKYIFKLIDNADGTTSVEKTITVTIVNPPVLPTGYSYNSHELNYDYTDGITSTNDARAKATDGTKIYIWIPRFAYNNTTKEIKFINGISDLTTDNQKIDENWTVPEIFENNENAGLINKTGTWLLEENINSLIN